MGMQELLTALDAGQVLEVFGAGTACVVCPVGSLLYNGKVRLFDFLFYLFRGGWAPPCGQTKHWPFLPSQTYHIPTMQNGPELAKRFYKELTDIQVSAGKLLAKIIWLPNSPKSTVLDYYMINM